MYSIARALQGPLGLKQNAAGDRRLAFRLELPALDSINVRLDPMLAFKSLIFIYLKNFL